MRMHEHMTLGGPEATSRYFNSLLSYDSCSNAAVKRSVLYVFINLRWAESVFVLWNSWLLSNKFIHPFIHNITLENNLHTFL